MHTWAVYLPGDQGCGCIDGYYKDYNLITCKKCHSLCETCIDNENNCTQCRNTGGGYLGISSLCVSDIGYYYDFST